MKKGYILSRLIRSVASILIIMIMVFIMVYAMVPRQNIFFEDGTYTKLGGKPDEKTDYVYTTWEDLGYLDYVKINDYCEELYGAGDARMKAAIQPDSPETAQFVEKYIAEGYTVEFLKISGKAYAYKDIPLMSRLVDWFTHLLVFDTINSVQDPDNPDLERSISFGRTPTGGLAIIGSGSVHKYLFYTDTRFPYLHQNFIKLNMGVSYPTYKGMDALAVMFNSQGTEVKVPVTYETGKEAESAINFGTLTYKYKLDSLDKKKFTDHYANYTTNKDQPSMVGTSFIMGILAIVLAYGIGLPVGLSMAKHKDGLVDKLGMVYIIFIIAVPSLAYIYLFRLMGTTFFGLPSAFPILGPGDIRSWILPTISLALPSISSLMLWSRRYFVDQMSSDYVKFARAKGLNQKEIFRRHIFKNAIIPIAQGIPSSILLCITGAIMTEAIYSVGGMGKMIPDAAKQYNNIILVALTFLFSSVSVLSVLLGDILITKIDPRISLSEKAGRS